MNHAFGRPGLPFILLFLSRESSYGFALLKKFEDEVPHSGVDSAFIYRSLKKLEDEGAVISEWHSGKGPARKYYQITDSGRKKLNELRDDLRLRHARIDYFLREYEKLRR